jgi:hypothetical protein
MVRSLSYVGTLPRQFRRFIEQCYMIGYTTLPIVAILSFFIGTVLALRGGLRDAGLRRQGVHRQPGRPLDGRELGPMMVVLLAGRVGSAIAAELASMKVYQEIDALTTMNIPPAKMLVLPRLAAVLVMMPVLIIIANIVGWFGGAVVARYVSFIGIEPRGLFRRAAPLHEVQGRVQRDGEGRGVRLRGRPGVLQHRAQHPRRPARDRRRRHPRRRGLPHPHPRPRLLRDEDPHLTVIPAHARTCQQDPQPLHRRRGQRRRRQGRRRCARTSAMEVALKNVSFEVKPGRDLRPHGPQRLGQERAPAPHRGPGGPDLRDRVTIDGQRPALAEATREHVRMALVFQAGALFNSLSVYDNLALYPREHRWATRRRSGTR